MMRIITGRARGTKLAAPKGEVTRPTAERTKEAVFSILQFDIAGREVLDLFAGSGQMGLEALSRGAAHAFFCDRSKDAVEVIRANALKTRLAPQCEVLCADYASALQTLRRKQTFDLVFLDPPYAAGLLADVLSRLARSHLLRDGATLVCETGEGDVLANVEARACYSVERETKYGIAYVTILKYHEPKTLEEETK
ncbi:MAG: 16S rRNA (guanine(966)-N(2))-methyltransferase RsmD [Ruminococcaceae bacterium]|nr:16S rRNA (guanine(966)-N(2))-methyltransferase RsmD [Oscillospiraceae bacterium]